MPDWGAIGGGIGGLIGAGLGAYSTWKQGEANRKAQADENDKARQFQVEREEVLHAREDTSLQRMSADAKAAGIHPVAMLGGSAGATSPHPGGRSQALPPAADPMQGVNNSSQIFANVAQGLKSFTEGNLNDALTQESKDKTVGITNENRVFTERFLHETLMGNLDADFLRQQISTGHVNIDVLKKTLETQTFELEQLKANAPNERALLAHNTAIANTQALTMAHDLSILTAAQFFHSSAFGRSESSLWAQLAAVLNSENGTEQMLDMMSKGIGTGVDVVRNFLTKGFGDALGQWNGNAPEGSKEPRFIRNAKSWFQHLNPLSETNRTDRRMEAIARDQAAHIEAMRPKNLPPFRRP